MYLPASFRETDRGVLYDLIDEYGFATLFSGTAAEPVVSHLPLLLDRDGGRLLGHMARANAQWRSFDGQTPLLAIFHGPHAYVSPSWYRQAPSVPTWSYAVVHVSGRARTLDAAATRGVLQALVARYESGRATPWPFDLPEDFVAGELRAIVGFEVPIERLEGKLKLGQNKAPEDRAGALAGLAEAPDHGSRELAAFARGYFARGSART